MIRWYGWPVFRCNQAHTLKYCFAKGMVFAQDYGTWCQVHLCLYFKGYHNTNFKFLYHKVYPKRIVRVTYLRVSECMIISWYKWLDSLSNQAHTLKYCFAEGTVFAQYYGTWHQVCLCSYLKGCHNTNFKFLYHKVYSKRIVRVTYLRVSKRMMISWYKWLDSLSNQPHPLKYCFA